MMLCRLYGLSGQDLGGGIGMDQAFDLVCMGQG
jgi:hypothetical protein